jgi:pyruvate/2-oxoglutarate dehydrogenase complex dihydrolipoamide acyltransferase (E2) component
LNADDIPASGDRLSVSDVEAYLATRREAPTAVTAKTTATSADLPRAAGKARALTTEERGMLRTVLWHRDEAVPGYVEIQYDTAAWDAHAKRYQEAAGLLMSPLLALMAHRVVQLASTQEALNSTIVGDERFVYDGVNLGMTVQSDRALYLAVLERADRLTRDAFVTELGQLQRRAFAHALRATELTGATIAFTSMARWQVSRHVPILPPHTSLIVAHAASVGGIATLGATYDHRVLTGYDVLSALRALSTPEEPA